MMVSPGYTYEKAPDQKHFLGAREVEETVSHDPVEPQEDLALQRVADVHGISDGQAST